ncbi:MAG: glycosyl hydrolase family 2, partial [Capsulimonas sp.]|nr:glycosyl hydrolase family 2 [Capsulimonas sp.]
ISEVWVNGVKVGSHTGMFGPLDCDITQAVKPGRNVIAVHCIGNQNRSGGADKKVEGVAVTVEVTGEMLRSLPHGMFPGEVSGIWQPVKLVVTNPIAVEDVFVRPSLTGAAFDVSLSNHSPAAQSVDLRYRIVSVKDGSVLYQSPSVQRIEAVVGSGASFTITTPKLEPKLWTPDTPSLYRLTVSLSVGGKAIDSYDVPFGFRTFGVDKARLLLNGKPYWLRGADHFPNTLRPNDIKLARRFTQMAHDGNVRMTRSHTVPFTQAWLDAADSIGMGVSYEGTWPWLMLEGPPPSLELLKVWKDEYSALIHKYRNHPSILIWTVNNESKFPILEQDNIPSLTQKWTILDDMIRTMRGIDPTRPIVADSSYTRAEAKRGYNTVVKPKGFDDGDIDDTHRYYGWYNESPFHLFDGAAFAQMSTPGRPLISQEMSTGYPSNDGHPTRSYLFQHATPLATVGNDAYENADPNLFLSRQSFMTKELAEALRRANRQEAAGILHFAYLTWFTDVWNADTLTPKVTYYALKTALQPVLVSAELYGRHFYAGQSLTRRVCVVNDAESGEALPSGRLVWKILARAKVLAQGDQSVASVPYYSNMWLDVNLKMPASLPSPRVDAQLVLTLEAGGRTLSTNRYDVILATREWADAPATNAVVFDPGARMASALQGRNLRAIVSLDNLDLTTPLIVGDPGDLVRDPEARTKLTAFVNDGGRVLLWKPGADLVKLFPDQVKTFQKAEGEMVTMHVPESPVFDGLETLDMAWFEMGQGHVPYVSEGRYHIDRARTDVRALADQCDIHAYLKTPQDVGDVSGTPLVEIRVGAGRILASEMMLDRAGDDPIAGRLLSNLLRDLAERDHPIAAALSSGAGSW